MKYLKSYENNLQNKPKVGDYVIVDFKSDIYSTNFKNFIDNSIGLIWKETSNNYFFIKYFNIPKDLEKEFQYSDYLQSIKIGNSILIPSNDVKYFSKNKEDLYHYISAKKYNL